MAILDQPSSGAGLSRQEQDLDEVFSALAHRRRRYVLCDLVQRFHPVALHDLAARLSAREFGESATDETDEEVRTDLLENQIPPLVEAGLVEFSRPDERLSLTERGMRAERLRRTGIETLTGEA